MRPESNMTGSKQTREQVKHLNFGKYENRQSRLKSQLDYGQITDIGVARSMKEFLCWQ